MKNNVRDLFDKLFKLDLNEKNTNVIQDNFSSIQYLDLIKDINAINELGVRSIAFYNDSSDENSNIIDTLNYNLNLILELYGDSNYKDEKYVQSLNKISSLRKSIEEYCKNNLNDVSTENLKKSNMVVNFIIAHIDELDTFIKIYSKLSDNIGDINKNIDEFQQKTKNELEEKTDNIINELTDLENKQKEKINNFSNNIIKDIEEWKEKNEKLYLDINDELLDLKEGIKREELARYFEQESKALKGKFDNVVIIIACVLEYIYVWWRDVKIVDFKEWIFPFFIVIIISQIIYNVLMQYRRNCNAKNSFWNKISNNGSFFQLAYQKTLLSFLTPFWGWLFMTFLGMISIFYVAYEIFEKYNGSNICYEKLLPYTPIYMVLIWFTWFCSKQFSYVKQVCDEYEYKFALSKSYLGYRKEAEDLVKNNGNVALLVALLDGVINNISKSPMQNIRNDNYMPISEIFQTVKDNIKKSENA